jgi:hypothetical protein
MASIPHIRAAERQEPGDQGKGCHSGKYDQWAAQGSLMDDARTRDPV